MRQYFNQLYVSTGDLLKRATIDYITNELIQFKVTYDGIEYTRSRFNNNDDYIEKAIETLEYMKARLLTILEDKIYTA